MKALFVAPPLAGRQGQLPPLQIRSSRDLAASAAPVPSPALPPVGEHGRRTAEQESEAAIQLQAAARGRSGRKVAADQKQKILFSEYKLKRRKGRRDGEARMTTASQQTADINGDGVIDLHEALMYMRAQSLRRDFRYHQLKTDNTGL